MRKAAAQPTPQITALLQAYEQVLDFAAEVPRAVFLKRRSTRLGWCIRVPRLRWQLKFFLVLHIRRTLWALRRRCYTLKYAPNTPESCEADLDTLTAFERSLPPTLSSRVALFGLVPSVFFVSFVVANYGVPNTAHVQIPFSHCNQTTRVDRTACERDRSMKTVAAKPLGTMTGAILTLDRKELINGFKSFACDGPFDKGQRWRDCTVARTASSSLSALFLLPAAIWLLLLAPMLSLRLKRLLFLTRPRTAEELKSLYAAEPSPHPENVYELEARAFEALKGRRVSEVPFDLVTEAMLMVPLLFPGVAVLALDGYGIWFASRYYSTGDATVIMGLAIFGGLLLLGPIGRLVSLRRTAQRRARDETKQSPRGAVWWRRVVAQIVDAILICGIGTAPALFVYMKVGQSEAKWIFIWLVVLPASAVLYHAAFLVGGASWAGQTLGKRLTDLRVVGEDGSPPSFARLLVRESLLKWFLFLALALPAVLNVVWPLWDYRRRAWHDIATGTVVVRALPVAETVSAAQTRPVPA